MLDKTSSILYCVGMNQPEYIALVAEHESRAARRGEIQVMRNGDGITAQPIVRYAADAGQDPRDVLAAHGWMVIGQSAAASGPDNPMSTYKIEAHDWPAIITTVTALKSAANAAWLSTIRDARGPMKEICAAAGVTDKRVYQIRSGTTPASAR